MEEPTVEELPLPALFERVRRTADAAERLDCNEPRQAAALRGAAASAQCAEHAVERAALFSTNETAEDIPTPSLKYLLLPYYLAQLAAALAPRGSPAAGPSLGGDRGAAGGVIGESGGMDSANGVSGAGPVDPNVRRAVLLVAAGHYRRFLEAGRCCGVLGPGAETLLASADDPDARPMDANAKRLAKIQRFKRERELKQQLAQLRSRQDGSGGADDDDRDEDDDEDERKLWLATIELAGIKAAEACSSLREEAAILQHVASLPADLRQRAALTPPPELMQQMAEALANLQGSSGMQGRQADHHCHHCAAQQRARMAAQVFRPSHILPTMTLNQFADEEIAKAQEDERRQREAEAARRKVDPDEAEDDDEELARARAMDDFKDHNRRGCGNSKLRPCG